MTQRFVSASAGSRTQISASVAEDSDGDRGRGCTCKAVTIKTYKRYAKEKTVPPCTTDACPCRKDRRECDARLCAPCGMDCANMQLQRSAPKVRLVFVHLCLTCAHGCGEPSDRGGEAGHARHGPVPMRRRAEGRARHWYVLILWWLLRSVLVQLTSALEYVGELIYEPTELSRRSVSLPRLHHYTHHAASQ